MRQIPASTAWPWLLAASALPLLGCPPAEDPCGEPTVEIGTGWERYEPLTPGDDLVMVHGPQGGWHLLVSARVTGLGEHVTLHVQVFHDATDTLVADGLYEVRLRTEDGCTGTYPGMFAILSVDDLVQGEADTPPELLVDEPMRIRVDAEGELDAATAEIVVFAVADPVDATR